MFDPNVTPFSRQWEAKQAQESLTQEAIDRHSQTKDFETKFLLQHQEQERAFNLDATERKNAQSKAQGEWLDKGWEASKDAATKSGEPGSTVREQAAYPREKMLSDIRQQATGEPSAQDKPQGSEAPNNLVKSIHTKMTEAEASNINFKEIFAQKPPGPVVKETDLTPLPNDNRAKEPFSPVLGGIQNALKETNPMPGFFSTSSNTGRERGWRQPSDEELSGLNASARLRQGAIVEPAKEYKNVSVQETLMPRLQELVQKLSSMGHSWARVVVPVDSRTNVIVRFNSQSGRVKIHLSTTSDELCEMIKSGWGVLAGNMSERGINLDEPTFETNKYDN